MCDTINAEEFLASLPPEQVEYAGIIASMISAMIYAPSDLERFFPATPVEQDQDDETI